MKRTIRLLVRSVRSKNSTMVVRFITNGYCKSVFCLPP